MSFFQGFNSSTAIGLLSPDAHVITKTQPFYACMYVTVHLEYVLRASRCHASCCCVLATLLCHITPSSSAVLAGEKSERDAPPTSLTYGMPSCMTMQLMIFERTV